jgi:tetratricopeptide (TPR) repeat protein
MANAQRGIRFYTAFFAVACFAGTALPASPQSPQSADAPASVGAQPVTKTYAAERAAALDMRKENKDLDALPLFESLYSQNQNDLPVIEGLARGLVQRAATQIDPALRNKDLMRAKELIDRARSLGDQSQLVANLGETLKGVNASSTLSFSSKADADAAMKAGEAAFAQRNFDEAIKNYTHAIEIDPSNYWATLFIGDSYFAAKKFPEAGEWYTKAQELDPNQETAFRYHADMLTKQGDFAGARKLAIEAIVAAPYDSKTWRELVEWGKAAHAQLYPIRIQTGSTVAPTDKGANITFDPSQIGATGAVWFAYAGERALWQEKFKQVYPNEKQYRHTLAEEVDGLTTAAKFAEEMSAKQKNKALDDDVNVQMLLKLYRANLLEPYVLLNGADQSITQDYVAYRAQNRAKRIEYLGTFVAPEAAPQTTPAQTSTK